MGTPRQPASSNLATLEEDIMKHQREFVERDRAYDGRILSLREEILDLKKAKTGWMDGDARMASLRELHRQINANVDTMKNRAAQLLEDQESDLIRAFRARLFNVREELAQERNNKDDGTKAWIAKERDLARDLEIMKVTADKNDRLNQTLQQANERLRVETEFNDRDRELVAKQLLRERKAHGILVAAKAEALKVARAQEDHVRGIPTVELEDGHAAEQVDAAAEGTTEFEAARGLKRAVRRVKKLLDCDRRAVQEERREFKARLALSSQYERFLRMALTDIHYRIRRQREKLESSVEGVDKEAAERSLKIALTQERVLMKVFGHMFPTEAKFVTYGFSNEALKVEHREVRELLDSLDSSNMLS